MQIGLANDTTARAELDRFQNALSKLAGSSADFGKILLAVSGGPDSLALLLLAAEALPGRIVAATVDHGLRAEAKAEAHYVAKICASRGVPHHILMPGESITGNIQSSARAVRYRLLENCADTQQCSLIATAHHADDQLETMLMRLARGSGVNGLAGVRARQGRIIRPLLDFTKPELEAICINAGVQPIRDPSNENSDFDRVAMRKWLASGGLLDPLRAVRSAAALADAAEALDWVTAQLAREKITGTPPLLSVDLSELPKELRRRLFQHALSLVAPDLSPRGEALDRCLEAVTAHETTMLGDVLIIGQGQTCDLRPAPPRKKFRTM